MSPSHELTVSERTERALRASNGTPGAESTDARAAAGAGKPGDVGDVAGESRRTLAADEANGARPWACRDIGGGTGAREGAGMGGAGGEGGGAVCVWSSSERA